MAPYASAVDADEEEEAVPEDELEDRDEVEERERWPRGPWFWAFERYCTNESGRSEEEAG